MATKKMVDPILEFELIGKEVNQLIERTHNVCKSLHTPAAERLHGHLQRASMQILNALQSAEATVSREMAPTPVLEEDDEE